jgi:hypothetical protein
MNRTKHLVTVMGFAAVAAVATLAFAAPRTIKIGLVARMTRALAISTPKLAQSFVAKQLSR